MIADLVSWLKHQPGRVYATWAAEVQELVDENTRLRRRINELAAAAGDRSNQR